MKRADQEARRWFLQAEDDLKFVEWVMKEEVFFDKGCFIAQQAGEKALKACLYAGGKRFVLGHSLFEMALELGQKDALFRGVEEAVKRLDRYYIPARYPNGLPGGSPFQTYTARDLDAALKDVETVVAASRAYLKNLGIL
jgi:HEPN domain-containing protein